jgi:hypothetical protein
MRLYLIKVSKYSGALLNADNKFGEHIIPSVNVPSHLLPSRGCCTNGFLLVLDFALFAFVSYPIFFHFVQGLSLGGRILG